MAQADYRYVERFVKFLLWSVGGFRIYICGCSPLAQRLKSAYTLTGETKSLEVPVGTEVITKLGVVTTFSRLSSGNIIAVLLEEGTDNILKIWIVS